MKKPRNTSHVLLPELLQHIAVHISPLSELLAFLQSFPERLLSEPLKALLHLPKAIQNQQEGWFWFWPYLSLPLETQNQTIVTLLKQAMPAIPLVYVGGKDCREDLLISLSENTKVTAVEIYHMEQLEYVMERWCYRIGWITLGLHNFSSNDLQRLCQAVMHLPALRTVVIDWELNGSESSAYHNEWIQALSKSSVCNIRLHYFDNAKWDSAVVNLFASWLSKRPIRIVYLSGISLSADDAEVLTDSIWTCPTLRKVNLFPALYSEFAKRNRTVPSNLKSLTADFCLARALDAIQPSIEPLHLSNFKISYSSHNEVLRPSNEFWFATLSSWTCLQKLTIEDFELCDEQVEGIASFLPHSNLVTLRLSDNNIGDKLAKQIITVLPLCKQLTRLFMICQGLTHLSATSFAKVIPHCSKLRLLDISRNGIGSSGAVALCPVLKYLDEVSMYHSYIGSGGANAISQVLYETEHMKYLNLSSNLLGSGVRAIIQALCKSKQRAGVVNLTDTLPTSESYETYQDDLSQLPEISWCLLK